MDKTENKTVEYISQNSEKLSVWKKNLEKAITNNDRSYIPLIMSVKDVTFLLDLFLHALKTRSTTYINSFLNECPIIIDSVGLMPFLSYYLHSSAAQPGDGEDENSLLEDCKKHKLFDANMEDLWSGDSLLSITLRCRRLDFARNLVTENRLKIDACNRNMTTNLALCLESFCSESDSGYNSASLSTDNGFLSSGSGKTNGEVTNCGILFLIQHGTNVNYPCKSCNSLLKILYRRSTNKRVFEYYLHLLLDAGLLLHRESEWLQSIEFNKTIEHNKCIDHNKNMDSIELIINKSNAHDTNSESLDNRTNNESTLTNRNNEKLITSVQKTYNINNTSEKLSSQPVTMYKRRNIPLSYTGRSIPLSYFKSVDQQLHEQILLKSLSPVSLKTYCFLAIRNKMFQVSRGHSILDKFQSLPLPRYLKKFISLENFQNYTNMSQAIENDLFS